MRCFDGVIALWVRVTWGATILSLVLAGCLEVAPQTATPTVLPEGTTRYAVNFLPGEVVDPARYGFEPSLSIASDGAIYMCSTRGLSGGANLWRSLDGGATFEFIGLDVVGFSTPVVRSGTGDLGGGDCDLAVDTVGRVYLVEGWLGSVSVASSPDRGESWRGVPISHLQPLVDRPWALGGDADELFVISRQLTDTRSTGALPQPPGGIWVIRSTDGGLTFPQQVLVVSNHERPGWYSNLAWGSNRLFFVYPHKVYEENAGEDKLVWMAAISSDRGATWQSRTIVEQPVFVTSCSATTQFPAVTADQAGGMYATWAANNAETGRVDLFFAASPDGGEHWNEPVIPTDRPGTRAFPWIAAEDAGRVGIAWYETNMTLRPDVDNDSADPSCTWRGPAVESAEWFLHYAESGNAMDPGPSFRETLVQLQPVHRGTLDRPYAELMQVEFDNEGRAATAYVADVPEGEARPMFALQSR